MAAAVIPRPPWCTTPSTEAYNNQPTLYATRLCSLNKNLLSLIISIRLFSARCIIDASHWHLCHCCIYSDQYGACAVTAATLDQDSAHGWCLLPQEHWKVLGGGENSPHQSNLLGADRTWSYVVMTQHHQPTTPGAETIPTDSSKHEQIDSAPGKVGWWRCKFLWGTQKKTDAASNGRATMGDWLVWGQFLNPNVNQDTIGKLLWRAFD